jgi:anti-sigma28 factor (negative regulator of flagellin synthesis)
MNIERITSAYGAKPYQSSSKSGRKEAPEKSAAVPKEQVELSDVSQNIRAVTDTIADLPDIRLEVVEQIRTKIKYNGYPIESSLYKAIEKMVNDKVI